MANWSDYKETIKRTNQEIAKDIEEIEAISKIVGTMIKRRHAMNLSQRELAQMCSLPQSSIARIESGKSSPNLTTLLNIFGKLGLCLSVQQVSETQN